MEQTQLYNATNYFLDTVDVRNTTVDVTIISAYLCPTDDTFKLFNYWKWISAINNFTNLADSHTRAPTNYVASWGDMKVGSQWDIYSGDPLPGNNWGCGNTFRSIFGDCINYAVTSVASCTDGTSNTLLVGENAPCYNGSLLWLNGGGIYASAGIPLNWLTNLQDGQVDVDGTVCGVQYINSIQSPHCFRNQTYNHRFKSKRPGGAYFAFADGSVHFIKQSIGPRTDNALASRAGGEVVSSDSY
jgi:prepilin-type processing-associated H-X9-DG protein